MEFSPEDILGTSWEHSKNPMTKLGDFWDVSASLGYIGGSIESLAHLGRTAGSATNNFGGPWGRFGSNEKILVEADNVYSCEKSPKYLLKYSLFKKIFYVALIHDIRYLILQ